MLKRILNLPESVTDKRLRDTCAEFGAKVYPKIRVADVFEIEGSGISRELYSYSMRAHFDFLITESDDTPIFAVEFDGPGHDTEDAQRRDKLKNDLCDRFRLQLLRINQKYLSESFSSWDLVSWFCTVWFVKRGWNEAVDEGKIHYEDAIFDPMFVSVRTKSGTCGLELERHARSEFGRLFQNGSIPDHMPEWIVAKDENNTLRALAWISVSETEGVIVETAMKQQRVGDWAHFAIRGIVLSRLEQALSCVIASQATPIPIREIRTRATNFKRNFKIIMALGRGAVGT